MMTTKWYDLDDDTEAMMVFPDVDEEFTFSERAIILNDDGQGVMLPGMPHSVLRVKRPKVSAE